MKICITGPPRAGKTTLSRLLARVLRSRLAVIHGDDFIEEFNSNCEALSRRLVNDADYIFEHVSAAHLMRQAGASPDLLIFLQPPREVLTGRGVPEEYFLSARFSNQDVQRCAALGGAAPVVVTPDVASALRCCLEQLENLGFFPPPLHTVVIKVASQCNLNCSYCYMYQGYDESWKTAPFSMSQEVATLVGRRIKEYFDSGCEKLSVVLHGGEPLSIPMGEFAAIVQSLQNAVGKVRGVSYGVQTNGTLLSRDYLRCLDDLGLGIGISLDGGPQANALRPNHGGHDTTWQTERGIDLCLNHSFKRGQFGGVLSVVNPEVNGGDVYKYFRGLGISAIDFLLKDRTHTNCASNQSSYDFLRDAFSAWLIDPQPVTVRLFKAIIAQLLDQNWSTDAIGVAPIGLIGVSTGGNWEFLDILRVAFPSAWQTPYNVFQHSIERVHKSAEFRKLIQWQFDYSETCIACKHLLTCGAGYLPNRYDGESFKNPSSHCKDLYAFIELVSHTLEEIQ